MGRELDMKIPADRSKIDTNNLGEFIWWSTHLSTGPEKLLAIIEAIGNKTEDVRKFILANR